MHSLQKTEAGTIRYSKVGLIHIIERSDNDPLWQLLKAKCMQLARERGVPPYVIFHDSTLLEILNRRPATLDALVQIGDVGQATLAYYGDAFLKVLEDAANA